MHIILLHAPNFFRSQWQTLHSPWHPITHQITLCTGWLWTDTDPKHLSSIWEIKILATNFGFMSDWSWGLHNVIHFFLQNKKSWAAIIDTNMIYKILLGRSTVMEYFWTTANMSWRNVLMWTAWTAEKCILCNAWWRHQMETISALLALCAGNSPVTGEFPVQMPVTRSFDFFYDLHLN